MRISDWSSDVCSSDLVPDGLDESFNVEQRQHGAPKTYSFKPKEHFDIGEGLGYMDFAAGVKLAGARFTVVKSQLARLSRALGQVMLDLHTTEFGYTEMQPPQIGRESVRESVCQSV